MISARSFAAPAFRFAVAFALAAAACAWSTDGAAQHTVTLEQPPTRINDGDTFEADLDGDGRLDFPRERVRLLYMDTPELHESHKGRDRAHGLPARDALAKLLAEPPLRLEIPADGRGDYGRTLAVVYAGNTEVNLALIRAGHSYFDTRFRFPPDYDRYAAAEGEAFTQRRGIWADAPSRERYLKRLEKEFKTPRSTLNPLYVPGLRTVAGLAPERLLGRYVRVRGRLAANRAVGDRGTRLLRLTAQEGADTARSLKVVAFPHIARRLRLSGWSPGTTVRVEGFIQRYRGAPELKLHYGQRGP